MNEIEQLKNTIQQLEHEIIYLKEVNVKLQGDMDYKLAACDCAAMMDTEDTFAQNNIINRDNDCWTPAFESVMRRTKETIDLRKECAELKAQLENRKFLFKIIK